MTAPLPHPIESTARSRPRHPVLVHGDTALTAVQLRNRVATRAGALAAAGVVPGDRVGLLGTPGIDFVVALHAIGWLGAVAAPLPLRATAAEQAQALALLDPKILLTDTSTAPASLPHLPLADGGTAPLAERPWPLDEVRLTLLSSGSTGTPKVIELRTDQLVFSAMGSALRLGHNPSDRWLCCLPLNHVGGLGVLFRTALYGTTTILHDRFDPAAVAAALDGGQATMVSLVPEMLRRVLDARTAAPFPATLRVILLGGAATPAPLIARCAALDAPVSRTWGMTETASQIATCAPGDLAAGSGPALAFTRVDRAVDGVLTVSGPTAPGGVLRTSDLGEVDAAGNVHVRGRVDDVILSGGEKVDPAEIEAVLRRHPDVADAAVVGRADATWGHRPEAWVEAAPGKAPTAETLEAFCRAHLAGFKVPASWRLVERLPRSALGKVQRGKLREG